MIIKLCAIICLIASSFAWLPPERCAQNKKSKRHVSLTTVQAGPTSDIDKIAAMQTENLRKMYKNHKFLSLSPKDRCFDGLYATHAVGIYSIYAPHNCSFRTYDPRLLATVGCSGAACKLSHSVTTVDTYTASEGYNWGVKISAKASFFEKLFEVGGEASTGGTYTCTYTKGKSTTDLVECSDSTGVNGQLQLYNVQTDMTCDFGEITLDTEERDNQSGVNITSGYFTDREIEELKGSAEIGHSCKDFFLMDPSNISDLLLQKVLDKAPLYNPYTDLILAHPKLTKIVYYKITSSDRKYKHVIPFTNEGGNSVYQYACIKTPF